MNRYRQIVVLFEDLEVRQEAIHFAVGLAERTGTELLFLLLLQNDSPNRNDSERLRKNYQQVLGHHIESIIKNDVPLSIVVRVGDPLSEFYKFMTEHPSFDTAVWGGNEHVLRTRTGLRTGHWLAQVEQELECPLVIPKRKTSDMDGR